MEKELKRVRLDGIAPAAWNPRTESEMDESHPAMKELVASVKAVGVIQPIDVWADGGMALGIVLAGNRRVKAATLAGLKEIPAMVFKGITEAQAREITRIENEVRLGVDPMRDASLVGEMLGLGFTQKEIAARFGVSEAQICRRRKLLDLCPALRKRAESADGNITIDALERIAVYPPDIQEACAKGIERKAKQSSTPLRWKDVSWIVSGETKNLALAKFDTEECRKCARRTGATPDLFGETNTEGLGSCLCAKCFVEKLRAWGVGELRKEFGDVELVDGEAAGVKHKYDVQYLGEFGAKKSKSCPALWYWVTDYDGDVEHLFGPTPAQWKKKKESDKKKAEAAKAKADAAVAKRNAEAEESARLRTELNSLNAAVEKAVGVVTKKVWDAVKYSGHVGADDSHAVKMIASAIGKSVKDKVQRSAIASLLVTCFDNDIGLDEEVVAFCGAFPGFAEKCGVKDEDFMAITKARAALGAFRVKHPGL